MDSRTGRSCLAMVTRRVCEALTIPVLSPLAHAAGCDFAVPPNKVISNLLALGLQALIHLLVSKIGQNPQQFIGCNVTTAALDFVGIDGLCELLALGREVVIRVAELPTFARMIFATAKNGAIRTANVIGQSDRSESYNFGLTSPLYSESL